MWKKLTIAVTLFSVVAVLAVQLAAKPPKDRPPKDPPPSGPGLIAVNDVGFITVMKADGTEPTAIDLMLNSSGRGANLQGPAWSPMFPDGRLILAYPRNTYNQAGQNIGTQLVATILDPANLADRDEHVVFTSPIVGAEDPPHPDAGGIFQVGCSPFEAVEGGCAFQVAFSTFRDLYDPAKRRQIIRIVGLAYDPSAPAGSRIGRNVAMDREVDAGVGAGYWQARFSPVDASMLALSRMETVNDVYTRSIWLAILQGDGGCVQMPLIDDSSGDYDWKPAWSPDGGKLAYLTLRRNKRKLARYIFIFDFATDSAEQLTTTSADWLSWSPDGEQIVYHTEGGQPNVGFLTSGLIGKIMLETGNEYDLGTGRYPDWSPDVAP